MIVKLPFSQTYKIKCPIVPQLEFPKTTLSVLNHKVSKTNVLSSLLECFLANTKHNNISKHAHKNVSVHTKFLNLDRGFTVLSRVVCGMPVLVWSLTFTDALHCGALISVGGPPTSKSSSASCKSGVSSTAPPSCLDQGTHSLCEWHIRWLEQYTNSQTACCLLFLVASSYPVAPQL